ncbi:di-heme-cytochrome C peroxidase [Actibacterium ureilyticum]|uniref:di-heme-cytochrome C peroxidase n=1 Tax=Actibacterium ureilyticum TaxID=1590614 RepID=UPI000BAAED0D|nr:di-heme-cytochrome C peroxidase [Actibacterium ureilyticum]
MGRIFTAFFILFACAARAEPFSANDVSILLEAPARASDPRLPVPQSILPDALATAAGAAVAAVNDLPTAVAQIDTALLTDRRAQWHVASIRIDPGAPGLGHAFAPFGRNLQIRLVVQPVNFQDPAPVRDEAVHLVYDFAQPVSGAKQQASGCAFRVLPDQGDIDAFQAALDDLSALKRDLAALGVQTDGAPLGVHPAFADPAAAELLIIRLAAFLDTHLDAGRLSALSVAGLPPDAPEPWVFLALQRDGDGFRPIPGPAIAQPAQTGAIPNFQQMLSFLDDPQNGAVVPPGLTRNGQPVDCLANFLLPGLNLPQPDGAAGVATSTLFGAGANSPESAAQVASVIADPERAHFFNTDCVSCHTETRRALDAAPDPGAMAAQIAGAEGIVADDLPRSPDGMGDRFDRWNIRAFGWFPGFPPTSGRAHATVTRRTARETAEVVACLNTGDWARTDRPCMASDRAQVMDQGWPDQIRRMFYHTSQGGAIMPLSWFLALDDPAGDGRFAAPENLARYGLLPSPADQANPHGLPVGLAVTDNGAGEQIGLNCAACHTGEVIAGGQRLRVDGAPASFDFDRFATDLAQAVRATGQLRFDDPAGPQPAPRLARFMQTLGTIDPAGLGAPDDFVPRFLAFASAFSGQMAQRSPAHPSGPGRVDALTQIVNAIAVKDLGIAANLATPRAPTSYPPLWLADRLEFVQWNLAVADPFARNVGQALGVFGTVRLDPEALFDSSADRAALELYETWISDLAPPPWPEDLLGPIDADLALQGRDLFAAGCEGCHNAPPFRMTPATDNLTGAAFIKVGAIPSAVAQTDAAYTRAFTGRWAVSGPLAELAGLPPVLPAAGLLQAVVTGVVDKALATGGPGGARRLRPADHPDCTRNRPADAVPAPCGYAPPFGGGALKAGPLIGVWATGPYLHNGSVRTVYQVISPPAEREAVFFIGDRTLDAGRLGFVSTEQDGAFRFDTRVPGNGNGGHFFWETPFTHEQKLAIIEYLKDPARFPMDR